MKKLFVFVALVLLIAGNASAQSVGIGISTPDNSAILHLNSSSKGFLLPAMSSTQRLAISSPSEGLLLHDFTTKSIWLRTSATWTELVTKSNNLWQENGTDIFRSSGNVGIGISNPVNKLHLHNGSDNFSFLRITNNVTGTFLSDGLQIGQVDNNASLLNKENGYLVLGANNDSMMFFTSAFGGVPRVGVGELFPSSSFDIKTTLSNVAKFNGGNQMYVSLYENGFGRGYIGSYAGNSSDVDFGTTGDDLNAKLHLTINFAPRLTISEKGNVGIGTTSPLSNTKLQVEGDSLRTAYFTSTHNSSSSSAILKTEALGGVTNFNATGIEIAQNGTQGRGRGMLINSGYIGAEVYSIDANFGVNNYGIISTATSDADCWGFYGVANGSGILGTKIGVYGSASGGATRWAFYGIGNAFLSGGTWQTSDERFKRNISAVGTMSEKLLQLEPRTYHFDTAQFSYMSLPSEKQFGFIASNMKAVFPDLVKRVTVHKERPASDNAVESTDFDAVNYTGLIPVLTQAINEHTKEISQMKLLLEEYRKLIEEQKIIIQRLSGNGK